MIGLLGGGVGAVHEEPQVAAFTAVICVYVPASTAATNIATSWMRMSVVSRRSERRSRKAGTSRGGPARGTATHASQPLDAGPVYVPLALGQHARPSA